MTTLRGVMVGTQRSFALLIDGDNVSVKVVRQIWHKLEQYGELRIMKVFHNKITIDQWEQIAGEYGVEPIWVPNNVAHKNSVDIALVMDAMTLLYEREDITGFCIIATDSDYARLARHLKRAGKFVLGIGQEQAPQSFRTACTEFIDLNEPEHSVIGVSRAGARREALTVTEGIPGRGMLKLLIEAYEQIEKAQDNDWVRLIDLRAAMGDMDAEFQLNPRMLAEKLKALAKAYPDWFEIHEQAESKPVLHHVRLPADKAIYMFLAAYVTSAEDRKLCGKDGWVQLSVVGQALQDLFPDSYPIRYKSVAKLQKVIEKISEDYSSLIDLNTEDEHPKIRFRM